jgi:hypothetical protein
MINNTHDVVSKIKKESIVLLVLYLLLLVLPLGIDWLILIGFRLYFIKIDGGNDSLVVE